VFKFLRSHSLDITSYATKLPEKEKSDPSTYIVFTQETHDIIIDVYLHSLYCASRLYVNVLDLLTFITLRNTGITYRHI